MQFDRSKTVKQAEHHNRKTLLNFYEDAPQGVINIETFYNLAFDRLRVLQAFEAAALRARRGSTEFANQVRERLRKANLRHFIDRVSENSSPNLIEEDILSHFTLRLAFSINEDLRRWFLTHELDLFCYRFENELPAVVTKFLKDNHIEFDEVEDPEEKDRLMSLMVQCRRSLTMAKLTTSPIFKVYFREVLDLVGRRQVYLEKGYAFITTEDLVGVVGGEFRAYISEQITRCAQVVPDIIKFHEQAGPLLKAIASRQTQQEQAQAPTGSVTPEMIDSLAKDHFPMCMASMLTALRDRHHLKHMGRRQFGLFLKGIGLSLENALRFWRAEFSRVMAADKFDKEYAYNIRHSYGQEGKRTNYRPFNCAQLISHPPPNVGETHGCPYKTLDPEILRSRLNAMGLSRQGVKEVMEKVEQRNYQVACSRVFELKRNTLLREIISHPNQFYEESRKLAEGTSDLQTGQSQRVETISAKVYSNKKKTSDNFEDSQEDDEFFASFVEDS